MARKRNEVWMNLKNTVLRERSKRPYTRWFHLYETSRRGKTIETESGLRVARGWGREEWRGMGFLVRVTVLFRN